MKKSLIVICLILCVLIAAPTFAEPVKRPSLAFDLGPSVAYRWLDHKAVNNYIDHFNIDPIPKENLSYGLGFRVLAESLYFACLGEGWSAKSSGGDGSADLWGMSFVMRNGAVLVRRTFVWAIYLGPGLDYSELNIDADGRNPDFRGWKLGLLGDVGMSFEYLFPVSRIEDSEEGESTYFSLPVTLQVGYAGEMIADPWYRKSGDIEGPVRDRFMGAYIRFGINIGIVQYSHSRRGFEMPGDDFFRPPRKKKKDYYDDPKKDEQEDEDRKEKEKDKPDDERTPA